MWRQQPPHSRQEPHSALPAVIDNIAKQEKAILELAKKLEPLHIEDSELIFALIIKEYLKSCGFSDFHQVCQDSSLLAKLSPANGALLQSLSEVELLNGQATLAPTALPPAATYLYGHIKALPRQQTDALETLHPDPFFDQAAKTVQHWLKDGTFEQYKERLAVNKESLKGKSFSSHRK